MEQSNIENQDSVHRCTSSTRERVIWIIIAIVTFIVGILIGAFLIAPHPSSLNQQESISAQRQQQLAQAVRSVPINGQVVSISHSGAQSGTLALRVSFDHVNGPTFQNPLPIPNFHNVPGTPSSSSANIKGTKTITVSFTKDTVFSTKPANEIKAGDYLSVTPNNNNNYVVGKSFTAGHISYFDPVQRIEQMVTGGNGHNFFGKITAVTKKGSSKVITISARIVNEKEFATTLLNKVASRPYPHSLLQSDVPYTNKTYTVLVNSATHIQNINQTAKVAVGTSVSVYTKEDINTTNKITAVSLALLPSSPQLPTSGK